MRKAERLVITMTKKELIGIVAEKTGCTKKAATETVNVVFDALAASITAGDKVTIDKFGTFTRKVRPARECHNPATGEKIKVGEKQVCKFKLSSVVELK